MSPRLIVTGTVIRVFSKLYYIFCTWNGTRKCAGGRKGIAPRIKLIDLELIELVLKRYISSVSVFLHLETKENIYGKMREENDNGITDKV